MVFLFRSRWLSNLRRSPHLDRRKKLTLERPNRLPVWVSRASISTNRSPSAMKVVPLVPSIEKTRPSFAEPSRTSSASCRDLWIRTPPTKVAPIGSRTPKAIGSAASETSTRSRHRSFYWIYFEVLCKVIIIYIIVANVNVFPGVCQSRTGSQIEPICRPSGDVWTRSWDSSTKKSGPWSSGFGSCGCIKWGRTTSDGGPWRLARTHRSSSSRAPTHPGACPSIGAREGKGYSRTVELRIPATGVPLADVRRLRLETKTSTKVNV